MSIQIRDATAADLPAVVAIYNVEVRTGTSTYAHEELTLAERADRFVEQSAQGLPLLVAVEGGRVLGFAGYAPFRPRTGYNRTMEHSVYLDGDARGRGLGRALMVAIIERARANGVHVLIGALDATNEASVRLHKSLGFTEVGRLPQVAHKFGRWLDLALFELVLDEATAP